MGKFSIRVYGLLINAQNEVLISREWHNGRYFNKFPGGGLEYGESTLECLRREFREELSIEIGIERLVHVSDEVFPSWFKPDTQVMGVYYLVSTERPSEIPTLLADEPSTPTQDGPHRVFWKEIASLSISDLSLPTDQQIIPLLKSLAAS